MCFGASDAECIPTVLNSEHRKSQPMPWRRPNIIKVWPGTIREQRRRPASVPIREHLYNSPPLSSSRVQVGGGAYTFTNLSCYLACTAILGQCLPHIAPVFRLYDALSILISAQTWRFFNMCPACSKECFLRQPHLEYEWLEIKEMCYVLAYLVLT